MQYPLQRSRSKNKALQSTCVAALLVILGTGCAKVSTTTNSSVATCSSFPVSAWVPSDSIIGSATTNHDAAVVVTKTSNSGSGKVTGLSQSYTGAGHQIAVNFTVDAAQLGTSGSVTLVPRLASFPDSLSRSRIYGWPVLVSLTAPSGAGVAAAEWVKLDNGCQTGFYTTPGDYSSTSIRCHPGVGSAFIGSTPTARFSNFDMAHRIGVAEEQYAVATFPTCKWGGTWPSTDAQCPFQSSQPGSFLDTAGKLPAGNYTATYVVLANTANLGDGYDVTLDVAVIQKQDATGGNGAVDVNFVLVGDDNVAAAATLKGQQNLNLLMKEVQRIYGTLNAGTTGIRLGKIAAYNWTSANLGGNYFTLDVAKLGDLFQTGSLCLGKNSAAATSEGKALNIFLVSQIQIDGVSSGILGVAGGVPGVPVNGTQASGLVFTARGKLKTYNASCTGSDLCPQTSQESEFIDMGSTIAHEMGHFMGLRHPDESAGTVHDTLSDTPQCTTTSMGYVNQFSCQNPVSEATCSSDCTAATPGGVGYNGTTRFCPSTATCGFNHVMWWASKNISAAAGLADGNIFSAQSGTVVNFSPYVQ